MLFRSNDTATTEIYTQAYTLSLHDALPISSPPHIKNILMILVLIAGIVVIVSRAGWLQ